VCGFSGGEDGVDDLLVVHGLIASGGAGEEVDEVCGLVDVSALAADFEFAVAGEEVYAEVIADEFEVAFGGADDGEAFVAGG
jgi:hypothetical protein